MVAPSDSRPHRVPSALPRLRLSSPASTPPSEAVCRALWEKYAMPDHIRRHSEQVARFAAHLAEIALEKGFSLNPTETSACGLLHDIAKSYTLLYGGSHAQLGAAWIVAETGHYGIAQGILHHVCWPWPVEENAVCGTVFLVMYADKRTMHTGYATLAERYEDILLRYGKTEQSRRNIAASRRQAEVIESALETRLAMKLSAYTPD